MIVNLCSTHPQLTVEPARLVFATTNWLNFHSVTISATEEAADHSESVAIMHSIPATTDFAGIDNAGMMRVGLAHTYVPEPEPEPTLDGLVVDLSSAGQDLDGRRMLLTLNGKGLWQGRETPPNTDSSMDYGSERIRGSRHSSLERADKLWLLAFPAGNPLAGIRRALEDEAQYLPLETPIPMRVDRGPAIEFSIIVLYLDNIPETAFGEDRIALVTSVSDTGEGWPAGIIFTYEPGTASALSLSEALDSRYDDFFLPGEYRFERGSLAGVLQVAVAPTDYDQDDDGLIEVSNLAQLNAIRFDLNGDGQPDQEAFANAYSQAFPSAIANMGIPNNAPAQGYELTSDLDFDTNHNGHAEEADAFWNKGHGWQSIGLFAHPFQAVLKGNEHKIVGLFQDQSDASRFAGKPSGLFGAIGNRGQVVGLGLEEVDIKGVNWVGAIAGLSQGSISHCSVSGQVVGSNSVGGLVGHNFGNIAHSFVNAEVSGVIGVSVFVGWNVGGSIESSSAQGRVNGATSAGDLVGLGTPAR